MKPILIAGAVVVVILVIAVFAISGSSAAPTSPSGSSTSPSTPAVPASSFTREDNIHYFHGKIPAKGGSSDGTIKFLGVFTSQAAAEAAVKAAGLKYYTWHGIEITGDYQGVLHASNVAPTKTPFAYRYSGYML